MVEIILMVLRFLMFAIFARVIVSWIAPQGGTNNPIVNLIYQITDPILLPFRRILPRVGMFDFTPTLAIITIAFIMWALRRYQDAA